MHFDTLSVHAGNLNDDTGSVTAPIHMTTTFERDEAGNVGENGFIYSRIDNPNRKALELKLALLEGGAEAFAFPSGMAAAMAVVQTVLAPDTHVIIPDDCYHGVAHLIKTMLPKWRIVFTEVDMTHAASVEKAVRPNTRLIIRGNTHYSSPEVMARCEDNGVDRHYQPNTANACTLTDIRSDSA